MGARDGCVVGLLVCFTCDPLFYCKLMRVSHVKMRVFLLCWQASKRVREWALVMIIMTIIIGRWRLHTYKLQLAWHAVSNNYKNRWGLPHLATPVIIMYYDGCVGTPNNGEVR
jgi:hypothetical protein